MINDLEPDILKCKLKWALGSITTNKASGSDGIPVDLLQIHASKFGKLRSGHSTVTGQFSFQSQRKATPKNVQTTYTHTHTQLHSSHMLVK